MTKLIYTTTFFLLLTAVAFAQPKGVTGRVTDSTGDKGLDKATVKLIQKAALKDTLRTSTNSSGEFQFQTVPASGYFLIITYSGYKPMVKEFAKPSNGVTFIDLGDLALSADYKSLGEIVIEAPAVVIKEDTVEYNASQFKTKPNATTEDLLKKLPGVQVDRNGNVTAQGKQVTRIKVNGKDFFTGDPKTATKEIPADMVDKVQVVDDYGDQAAISGVRDGEPEKVINLQLKKDKNKGVFGRVQGSAGTNDRYLGGINLNYFNNKKQLSIIGNSNNINQSSFGGGDLSGFGGGNFGGGGGQGGGGGRPGGMQVLIGAGGGGNNNNGQNQDGITRTNSIGTNYRSDFGKRNSFYGSYTYTNRSTALEQFQSQFNVLNNSDFITNQTSVNRQGTHRAFANLELWIDSFNYLKISPNFSVQNTNNTLGNTLDIFNSGKTQISGGGNTDTTISKRPSMRTNVLYNHRFKRRGRNLSINTDIGWSETDQDQSRFNIIQPFFNGTALAAQNTLQQITQDNRGFNINSRIVYSEPISKERLLDLSYNFNHNFTSNNRKTFQKDFNTGQFNFLDPLSNAFENNFNFNRFGATIRTIRKKYNYSIGVLLQPVTLRGYNVTKDTILKPVTNFNWFPVARLTYNFSRTKSFSFSYNGSAQQPSISQLQPVLDSSNRQFQTEGNPNLKPSVNHTLNFNYNNFNFSKGTVFFTNLALTTIRDMIVNNTVSIPFGQRTKPENVNGFYNANLFYTYSKPWKNRKYVLSLNGTANYTNSPVLLQNIEGKSTNWLIMQGFEFTYNAKEWLELSAGARYNLNKAEFSQNPAQNLNQTTWTFSNDVRIDIPKGWIMRWEFDYTLNQGLAAGVTRNIALLNGSLEKELFKKKNVTFRLQAFDIFNQNINVSRNVSANFITDSRVNRLAQYFMVGFVYRLNRFKGQQPQQNNFRRGGMMMNN
ncbi:MAG: outer membrane beta-barrel protein [Chitinophagaceae bacterium]|nr:outer membrane beta-barrel protein [Chitinophagaceae bacterium]